MIIKKKKENENIKNLNWKGKWCSFASHYILRGGTLARDTKAEREKYFLISTCWTVGYRSKQWTHCGYQTKDTRETTYSGTMSMSINDAKIFFSGFLFVSGYNRNKFKIEVKLEQVGQKNFGTYLRKGGSDKTDRLAAQSGFKLMVVRFACHFVFFFWFLVHGC